MYFKQPATWKCLCGATRSASEPKPRQGSCRKQNTTVSHTSAVTCTMCPSARPASSTVACDVLRPGRLTCWKWVPLTSISSVESVMLELKARNAWCSAACVAATACMIGWPCVPNSAGTLQLDSLRHHQPILPETDVVAMHLVQSVRVQTGGRMQIPHLSAACGFC